MNYESPELNKRLHVELTRPFPVKNIKWRVGATAGDKKKGIGLAYIDARDVMQRLDSIIGPGYWQAKYPQPGMCEISIFLNGQWVTKTNFAGETQVEAEKGQASDAFKRAAVLWGIGRYLYYLPNIWTPIKAQGRSHVLDGNPKLPDFAIPENWTKYFDRMFHNK